MPKKMLIDATHPEETRVVVADGNKVEDFDFESINKRQLAGNIYLAKVTRVEPSLQAAFVEYGGNRHGFLAFPEIHPDYYQIPMADREALLAEEERQARADADAEDDEAERGSKRGRRGRKSKDKDTGRSQKAAKDAAEDEGTADEPKEAKEGSKGGRRSRRRKSGREEAGVGGLEVIDLDAAPAEAAEEPAAVPKGLEIADPGAEAPAAKADESDAASDGPSNNSADDAEDGGEDGDDTPPRSMAEASGLDDESVSEDISADAPADAAAEATAPAPSPKPEEAAEAVADTLSEPAAEPSTEASSEPAAEAVAEVADAPTEAAAETPVEAADAPAEAAAETPKEGRKPRSRGGKSRRSRKSKDAEEATETADAASDGASDEDEIEQSGADDPREEIQERERTLRRRRYKIQDVIKVRQILLVQVVKEERGNKGAALTTYLSLAGRYCVLMPNTARGGGISRKITNATDRKRLREVVDGLDVPKGMGLIVRTAGAERTKPEIKRDYEFLLRQWEQVRELTLKSIAPCLIYEEGSLIKRSIRDIYSKDIEQVLVEGEAGYREAKDYMKMLTPSHAKNVQQYADPIPLFTRYQVESYLNGMFSPTVQLKSGGYIVIGITEALVAIDVNSGRSTKEGSVEDTALKTNLEAADEVARQLRLRDLAGLIVIDFIDMDENRNNRAVEKRMKERLKSDRARIQLGRISGFGLMEMSRQRLRPGMLEASTQPCPHCHGQGLIRSDDSLALAILREVEEEAVRGRIAEVTVTAPVDIANFMINAKRSHIARIEERHGIRVQVLGDPGLINPDYKLDRVRGQARDGDRFDRNERNDRSDRGDRGDRGGDAASAVVTASGTVVAPEETAETAQETGRPERGQGSAEDADGRGEDGGKRRRRGKRGGRRRRGRGEDAEAQTEGLAANAETDAPSAEETAGDAATPTDAEASAETAEPEGTVETAPAAESAPAEEVAAEAVVATDAATEEAPTEAKAKPARKPRAPRKSRAKPKAEAAPEAPAEAAETVAAESNGAVPAEEVAEPVAEAPIAGAAEDAGTTDTPENGPAGETASQDAPVEEATADAPAVEGPPAEAEAADEAKPKRRGWWSFGF